MKASDNPFARVKLAVRSSDIAAPTDGSWDIYSKPNGVFARSSNTVVGPFAAAGASSGLATDTLWDAKGDSVWGTGADTAAKLTVGTNGKLIIADSTQSTGVAWVAPQITVVTRTNIGSNQTTTSTTFVDIDSTNLTVTLTTRAVRVRLTLEGIHSNDTNGAVSSFNFSVDGTPVTGGTSDRGLHSVRANAAGASGTMNMVHVTDVLSAASHTFRPMFKTSSGTLTALQTASTDYIRFVVEELLYTS